MAPKKGEKVRILAGIARRAMLLALVLVAGTVPGTSWAATLPDHRGYELVSPMQKNGGDVRTISSRTQVAFDGDALIFPSYVGFGDVQGTQIDTEYLAERTGIAGTQGWVTRGITPRQEALTVQATANGVATNFDAPFTPDLSTGVYRAWRPLVEAPNVANVSNLYRIGGLRGTSSNVELLSDAVAPITVPSPFATFLLALRPMVIGASTSLAHIVFESNWALTADAPPGFFQSKLYEFADGALRLVGILPDGSPASGSTGTQGGPALQYFYPVSHGVSSDGSHVFFKDPSTGNVYVRIDGSTTVQLNTSEKTSPESSASATLCAASADGSRAFFITSEGLVDGDDDTSPDVYMYDENASPGARLTVLSPPGVFVDGVIGASNDGRYVYFVAEGTQLYVWHDGAVSFIGGFPVAGDAARNGSSGRYTFFNEMQRSRLSPDGRHLLFATRSDESFQGHGGFAGYDHAGHEELYLYSADSGHLECASCNPSGRPATDDALAFANRGFGPVTWHLSHALSDDGRFVFFNTGDALVPEDANGKIDAYEYDVADGTVHLLSSGTDTNDSFFLDASPSGKDVFIATRQRLVGWDVDINYDIYDARVDGGLPEPAARAVPCGGEGCQGDPAAQPAASRAASQAFRGAGDGKPRLKRHISARRRCVRGDTSSGARKHAGRCRRKRAHARRRTHAQAQRRSK
jgi:Tol biopolymer transport system component